MEYTMKLLSSFKNRRLLRLFLCMAVIFSVLNLAAPVRANSVAPANSVPLPLGLEAEPIENFVDTPKSAPVHSIEDDMSMAEQPLVLSPLKKCRGEYEHMNVIELREKSVGSCIKKAAIDSELALQKASMIAKKSAQKNGREAVRDLATANLEYMAFRDAECLKQSKIATDNPAFVKLDCVAILNETHAQQLSAPQ
jgi:hypothetical protein